jgi:acylphosphatase
MKKRIHVFVSGRVQGVFFRAFTQEKALENGLTGWVKNLRDGRVEAVLEGEKEEVERVIQALRLGPPHSDVEEVRVQHEDFLDEFKKFQIKYI